MTLLFTVRFRDRGYQFCFSPAVLRLHGADLGPSHIKIRHRAGIRRGGSAEPHDYILMIISFPNHYRVMALPLFALACLLKFCQVSVTAKNALPIKTTTGQRHTLSNGKHPG